MSVDNERDYRPWYTQPARPRDTSVPQAGPPAAAEAAPPWSYPVPVEYPQPQPRHRWLVAAIVALTIAVAAAAVWVAAHRTAAVSGASAGPAAAVVDDDPGVMLCRSTATWLAENVNTMPAGTTFDSALRASRYDDIRTAGLVLFALVESDTASDNQAVFVADYDAFAAACSAHGATLPSVAQIINGN